MRLAVEPLIFCLCWAGLAVVASVFGNTWAGLAVALGLLLVLMPSSAFILSRYEDEKLERQVRWGLWVIAALLFGIWMQS
jgi:uncharacterized membrane protein YedE/YeeE